MGTPFSTSGAIRKAGQAERYHLAGIEAVVTGQIGFGRQLPIVGQLLYSGPVVKQHGVAA